MLIPTPRVPPFLLNVRWKSGVTFVRICFRDEGLQYCLHLLCVQMIPSSVRVMVAEWPPSVAWFTVRSLCNVLFVLLYFYMGKVTRD